MVAILPTVLVFTSLVSLCGSVCDVGKARSEVDSLVNNINSDDSTTSCQAIKSLNSMRTRIDAHISTCADDVTGLSELLNKFFETSKMAPNIGYFRCSLKPSEAEIHTPEKSGCSKSGLINCTSNAYTIRDKIKESLDNDENAKQTDITKICQLFNNDLSIVMCMEANFANCSKLDGYTMKKHNRAQYVKFRQMLTLYSGLLDCQNLEESIKEEACMSDNTTLRGLLSCAPHLVAMVFSEQKINWKAPDTCRGISPKTFRECAREKSSKCSPLWSLMENVIYNVNVNCNETLSRSRDTSTPLTAQSKERLSVKGKGNTGNLGLPRELEAVLKEMASAKKLTSWKIFGGGGGTTILFNFDQGYMPQPSVCTTQDCVP